MEDKHTLSKAVDTVTEKTIEFEITIHPQNKFERWKQKRGWMPVKKEFILKPLVLGNLLRISRLLLKIDPELMTGKNFLDISHQLVSAHAMTLTEILAISIQGNRQEPSGKLIRLLKENLTPSETLKLLQFVLVQMDLTSFISSIISIRGLNVLENGEQKKEPNEVSPMSKAS